jgi:hypothetical protein
MAEHHPGASAAALAAGLSSADSGTVDPQRDSPRERLSLNRGWRFTMDDPMFLQPHPSYESTKPWFLFNSNSATPSIPLLGSEAASTISSRANISLPSLITRAIPSLARISRSVHMTRQPCHGAQSPMRRAYSGRALAIIRPHGPACLRIRAEAEGMTAAECEVTSR